MSHQSNLMCLYRETPRRGVPGIWPFRLRRRVSCLFRKSGKEITVDGSGSRTSSLTALLLRTSRSTRLLFPTTVKHLASGDESDAPRGGSEMAVRPAFAQSPTGGECHAYKHGDTASRSCASPFCSSSQALHVRCRWCKVRASSSSPDFSRLACFIARQQTPLIGLLP